MYRSSTPDYMGNYSNYSGISSSPKIQDSGSSSHSSNQYSPRSPTYNPKSPSYNIIQSSNINIFNLAYSHNSPYYNPNSNIQMNVSKNTKEGKPSPIHSDEENEDM
jgi:hypothetical protein